jgi:chromosomal replication initiation ATPase DnaA
MRPVIDAVLKLYRLDHEALVSPYKSTLAVTEARGVCWWLAKQLDLPLNEDELGAALGKKAKAVQLAVKRIREARLSDTWLRESTDSLLAELRS